MAKAVCVLVWLVPLGNEEGQVIGRRCCQYRNQVRVHLDLERRAGLLLLEGDLATRDVLLARADQVCRRRA